ncbi:pyruvate kinase [Legionella sp. W05-934-2]|jgi:pyruvate kinase|uniref:pyruvate kinase n=1 Tax=Legionella sp. W05-934-2 TaxID=1198649 RepID=UPI003463550D
MNGLRRTKIVATLGPASDNQETIEQLLRTGVNVFRFNLSHPVENLAERVAAIRQLASQLKIPVAIMADIQGPKIRIGALANGEITLHSGQTIRLQCGATPTASQSHPIIPVQYANLYKEVKKDDKLLLDDGLIQLSVNAMTDNQIDCVVDEGGTLKQFKGLNRLGGGLMSDHTMTEKDQHDIKRAVLAKVDFLALSFVRKAEEIIAIRQQLSQSNQSVPRLIAKIECMSAIDNLVDIIDAADAVMVARGDLGVEAGPAEVPRLQKRIIQLARQRNKLVITATQMMESMIHAPLPTRAEVSDVANAVLDGTDAVMLSAETASGKYPIKTVHMMVKICQTAETNSSLPIQVEIEPSTVQSQDQAIALGCMHTANHFPVEAILCLTESGNTAISLSRYFSKVPIFAISDNQESVAHLALAGNVLPIFYDYRDLKNDALLPTLIQTLRTSYDLPKTGYLLVTRGKAIGKAGGTDMMQIVSLQTL